MERTFKERAVHRAAIMKKKCKVLSPLIVLGLCVVLGFYNIILYFFNNGKKYVSVCVVFLFFLMMTSFATPDQAVEAEVYLSNNNDLTVHSQILSNAESDFEKSVSVDLVAEEAMAIFPEYSVGAEGTEDIEESFTLIDLYSDVILKESSDISTTENFDPDEWYLILVNKSHPIPEGYEVPLATIKGSMKCDERVLDSLREMLNAAFAENINLVVCSPYRDMELQKRLFLRKINAFMNMGMSYLEAYKITSMDVIVPGTSEHQLGLAFDIVTDTHQILDADFGSTKGGKWLSENCAKYGFIIRYPEGKEYKTGIEYEPWHFRYVGVKAATYIMENNITLEEFIEGL